MIPTPTKIYHLTHIDNLPSIIADGGLKSCRALRASQTHYTDIAYQGIQDRRAQKRVSCGPGGTLHDYVPFYFAPRSPMLYTISKGNVPGYSEGQAHLIYLVSTMQAVQRAGLPFVFTNGHGTMELTDFFADPAELGEVDWQLMAARVWKNTTADNDRKRRRQAEFLVHRFFSLQLVEEIAVWSGLFREIAGQYLAKAGCPAQLSVRKDWYF